MLSYGNTLSEINDYLSDKSYANFEASPTQLDRQLYDKVSQEYKIHQKLIPASGVTRQLPHLYRWFTHISSFKSEERSYFPQISPILDQFSKGALNLESSKSDNNLCRLDTRVCTRSS